MSLSDLWAVDPDLATSLQFLLDYDGSIQEDIGTTFVASQNPLLQYSASNTALLSNVVELKRGGADIFVTKANRAEFVDLFVNHALHGSCQTAISEFINGWRTMMLSPIADVVSDSEVYDTLLITLSIIFYKMFQIQLEALSCGSVDLSDFMRLRDVTSYEGAFSTQHPIILWFWVSILYIIYN